MPDTLAARDRDAMFALMDRVYDGVTRAAFEDDLATKDEVIVLRDPDGGVGGFSTQRFLEVPTTGPARTVKGVFSGDTVVAPEHWGSMVLFQAFSRRYIAQRDEAWYWFVICKGQRTYRILPTFFDEYWPSRRAETPPEAKAIMDAYGRALYPDEYNPATGVLEYRREKDRLRPGIAGVDEVQQNPDARFFAELNPGHVTGNDLVCLAELSPGALKERHRARLLG